MSLVTYPNSSKSKVSSRAPHEGGPHVAVIPTIASYLREAAARLGTLLINAAKAIAEARMQRAIFEAELYLNRYRHASNNDDDLPILR
jgi:hypothetical protein